MRKIIFIVYAFVCIACALFMTWAFTNVAKAYELGLAIDPVTRVTINKSTLALITLLFVMSWVLVISIIYIHKESRMNSVILLIGVLFLFGCKEEYPKYEIGYTTVVPDSLKKEYRQWIVETIRAASQHMSGGDYENVDATIAQAKNTALDIFGVTQPCLLVIPNNYSSHMVDTSVMTPTQRFVFNNLLKE